MKCRLGSPAEADGRESPDVVPRIARGPLRFRIVGWYGRPNHTQYWQDPASRPELETMLADIVVHILVAGEIRYRCLMRDRYEQAMKSHAAARERERLRREKEERERQAYLAKIAQDRVDDLLGMVARWQRARDLRAFVQAVTSGRPDILILPPPDSNQTWVGWALDLADQLDPLVDRSNMDK